MPQARLRELEAAEQFILPVAADGRGKQTSAYDYRTGNRGNSGLRAWDADKLSQGLRLAASFPIEQGDEVLLVTDGGQLIRTPVANVRPRSRGAGGVFILRTSGAERVVSVERLEASVDSAAEGGGEPDGAAEDGTASS